MSLLRPMQIFQTSTTGSVLSIKNHTFHFQCFGRASKYEYKCQKVYTFARLLLCIVYRAALISMILFACEKAGLGMVFLLHCHRHHQKDLFFNLMQYSAIAGTNLNTKLILVIGTSFST